VAPEKPSLPKSGHRAIGAEGRRQLQSITSLDPARIVSPFFLPEPVQDIRSVTSMAEAQLLLASDKIDQLDLL
jgi:hypothetical protein